MQAMGYPIAAELSSYRLRSKTMAMATISQAVTSWLLTFVTPYMFNVDSGDLLARVGFVFTGFSALLIVGAWFLIPETTNMTAAEIDTAYATGVAPRNFKKARNDGALSAERRAEATKENESTV